MAHYPQIQTRQKVHSHWLGSLGRGAYCNAANELIKMNGTNKKGGRIFQSAASLSDQFK